MTDGWILGNIMIFQAMAETNIPVFVRDRVMDIANKAYVRNASFLIGLCDFIHGILPLSCHIHSE